MGDRGSASPRSGIANSLDFNAIVPWDLNACPADVVKSYREPWLGIFK